MDERLAQLDAHRAVYYAGSVLAWLAHHFNGGALVWPQGNSGLKLGKEKYSK